MLNLIKKEFIIQKKYLFYYIFYSIFIFVIFSMSSNESAKSAYILAAVSVTYIFIQYSCAIEDRNNSERILNSLPISKKSIVLSKYFSLMIFSIIAVILSIVSGYIISKLDFIKVELIGIIDI
ncbi:MAG: ABC-2 transporter permease, partial [Clostridiales bacterium]|nr:ABC-2 transporter permease [Clostridiales bacterium]